MTAGVRNTVIGCLAFVAVVMAGFLHNISRERGMTDEELRAKGVVLLPRPRDIAPFRLVGADGQPFTNDSLQGRWSLVFFGYTYCPDACPTTLADLAKAEAELGAAMTAKGIDEPVQVVLVSVDPERDTPTRIAEYVHAFSPRFVGVGGTREAVAGLGTQVNVAFGKVPGESPEGYLVDHSTNIVVINPRGHYHGFMKPPFGKERLVAAVPGFAARL